MRQLSCKGLILLIINVFIFSTVVNGQDSSQTATKPTTTAKPSAASSARPAATAPAKTNPVKSGQTAPARTTTIMNSPATPADMSLSGQYEDLLKHSWMQQGYKVVNPNRLTTLWKSVTDSINAGKKQLALAQQKIAEQSKQINELQAKPSSKLNPSGNSTLPQNSIQVMGIEVDANTYNWVVWGVIILLAIALAVVLFNTSKNSSDAKHHKELYEEISSEYQTFKSKAKEKEMKLARELQTERNTVEELLAKQNPGS